MLIALSVLILVSPTPESAFEAMEIPDGFSKQLIAAEPLVMDPVSFCFDDQGNILVAESFRQENAVPDNRSSPFWLLDDLASQTIDDRLAMFQRWSDQRENGMAFYGEFEERIRRLSDEDGDGDMDISTIVADGFNGPLDGTGAGVLAIGDDVWFTMIPSLWRLRDNDGDGYAESQESVFRGFGVRVALRGHDLHGLALGLDGRLYWSMGDRGYHIELDDGQVLHSPGEGGVLRCELDGTDLEVFHHGLRNPQELAFDKYGNLFTGDNNSDAGDKARLVYCVQGGETGWRMEYQTMEGENKRGPWVQENGWDPHAAQRPAWILPAVDTIGSGPSGLVAYPGCGLSSRYDDHFFMCNFLGGASHSNVLSFAVEPEGAGFKMVDLHTFVQGVLCTDVDFGYDGRMVISDWGEGWQGNFEGRLYAVWDDVHRSEGDVSAIFNNGFKLYTPEELGSMLAHKDRRVRIRAQIELADRTSTHMFVASLNSTNQLARIHGMWGLAMIDRSGVDQMSYIMPLLDDPDPEIRAQACNILGEAKHRPSFKQITLLIQDASPRVSYFATIAAGQLGNPKNEILALLQRNANADVYLRHACVVALAQSQYASTLANMSRHPDASVRLAAVLALRKHKSQFVGDFLNDVDSAIATEAARAIHDVPIKNAMRRLASTLPQANTLPWKRRAISANHQTRSCSGSVLVAEFAADPAHGDRLRKLAMQALRSWKVIPRSPQVELDMVEGRVLTRSPWGACLGDIQPMVLDMVATSEGELLVAALNLASQLDVPLPDSLSRIILHDETQSIALREYCLRHLSDTDALEYALQSQQWQLRAASRDVMLDQGAEDSIATLLHAVEEGEMQEAQAAVVSLRKSQTGFSRLPKDDLGDELQLEYWESLEDSKEFPDPFDGAWLLVGGVPETGKQIVFEHTRSQCLRCHKVDDHGGIAGPPLNGIASSLTDIELLESLLLPSKKIVQGYGDFSAMPPMGTVLDYRELRDVIAYLKTLH